MLLAFFKNSCVGKVFTIHYDPTTLSFVLLFLKTVGARKYDYYYPLKIFKA